MDVRNARRVGVCAGLALSTAAFGQGPAGARRLAYVGDPLPWRPTEVWTQSVGDNFLNASGITPSGLVAFAGTSDTAAGTGPNWTQLAVFDPVLHTTRPVLAGGDQAPGMAPGVLLYSATDLVQSQSGAIASVWILSGEPGVAVYRSEPGGQHTVVARFDSEVPGHPGSQFHWFASVFDWDLEMNSAGLIVFKASFHEGGTEYMGLYAAAPGQPLARVIDTTMPVPGQPQATWMPFPQGGTSSVLPIDMTTISVSDAGDIVFRGRYRRGGAFFDAVYRRMPDGTVTVIADAGSAQSVPGQAASSRFYQFEAFHYVTAAGDGVFNSMNTNFDLGVYRSTRAGTLSKVYDRFDPVPGVGAVSQPLVYLSGVNNAGHVVVNSVFWQGGQQHQGIVLVEPSGTTRMIARDPVNGGENEFLDWTVGLNERGDVLYRAEKVPGVWEIFRYRHSTGASELMIAPGMIIDGMVVDNCWVDLRGRTSGEAEGFAQDGSFVAHVQLNGKWGMYLLPGFDGQCYADCNGDGALNLTDFGCFQTKFALGDAYADCNGDGVRNLSDFGCFQTKFALGCP